MKIITKRLLIEISIYVLVVLAFAYDVTGTYWHEIIGLGICVIVGYHHVYNFRWYLSLNKGRYNSVRKLSTFMNGGLAITFLVMIATGLLNSYLLEDIFGFIWNWDTRDIHVFCAYWFMVFLGGHIGLHWSMIVSMTRTVFSIRKKNNTPQSIGQLITRSIGLIWGVYGCYVFIQKNIWKKLIYQQSYDFVDMHSLALYFFEMISIFVFLTLIAIGLNNQIKKFK